MIIDAAVAKVNAMIVGSSIDGGNNKDIRSQSHSRSLLSCSLSNKCGNACYGRCGPGCTCWSWFCGHCDCEPDCREHDYYCSCKSMSHFWCVNIFWVGCQ